MHPTQLCATIPRESSFRQAHPVRNLTIFIMGRFVNRPFVNICIIHTYIYNYQTNRYKGLMNQTPTTCYPRIRKSRVTLD